MAPSRLIIAGHSHTVALAGPAHADAPALRPLAADPSVVHLVGPWPRDPHYWEALVREAAGAATVILFGGNEHNHYFLFQSARPFDFVPSNDPGAPLEPGAELVPEAMIRAKYGLTLGSLSHILGRLRRRPSTRIAVCGTPPPKADESFMRAILAAEPDLVARAAQLGQDVASVPITPYELRFKLWRLLQDCLREIAEKAGCGFVAVPDIVYTPGGGLAREFWAEDASHANDAYGAVMLDHLRRALAA